MLGFFLNHDTSFLLSAWSFYIIWVSLIVTLFHVKLEVLSRGRVLVLLINIWRIDIHAPYS